MTTNITAANQFTPALLKQPKQGYSVSISGTFVATVVVQRSKDNIAWMDITSGTAPAEYDGDFATAYYVRAGVKTGGFTSGTVVADVY